MTKKKPIILLTNDDGISADGIQTLISIFSTFAEVWVVAPDRERSAVSHCISLHSPVRITEVRNRQFAVDGTPADCVYVAMHHLLSKKPDLIISGINHGANLGTDTLYSGTVAAAMEGALCGITSLAVSLALPENHLKRKCLNFNYAAKYVSKLAKEILVNPVPQGVFLNVNVPDILGEPKGVKLCRLGRANWESSVFEKEDPRGRKYYWIGGERGNSDLIEGTDLHALAMGWITLTPVHYDMTDYNSFHFVENLQFQNKSDRIVELNELLENNAAISEFVKSE